MHNVVRRVAAMSDQIIPTWTLGDRLAKARETAGIGVQQMARLLNISRNTVTNWEHGRGEPTRAAVMAYSTLTGVPMWWIEGQAPCDGGDQQQEVVARSTKWDAAPLLLAA